MSRARIEARGAAKHFPARADTFVGTCPDCGKLCFTSRSVAKKAARRVARGDGGVNVYRCGQWWHWGHLPRAVRAGVKARREIQS